jgi:hypothetical protein
VREGAPRWFGRPPEAPGRETASANSLFKHVRVKREGGRMSFDEAYDELVERISDRVVEKLSANRADPRPNVLD